MRMMIAPKLLARESEQVHVRVSPPDSDGITQTRTQLFNETVSVEYLDGHTKSLHSGLLVKEEAFCVQMLRMAFEPACWKALD
jgi:glycine cleavage system regulatory protein